MAIKVALNHKTHYKYDRAINLGPHVLRLRPAAHSRTPIEAYSLKIIPEKHFINWQQDPFGNYQARLVFPETTKEFVIEVDLIANMEVINPFDFFVEEYADKFPFQYDPVLKQELEIYLKPAESGPLLTKWMETIDRSPMNIVDFLVYINQKLWKDINYTIRLEPGVQTCETTLDKALGSCRDTGWLLVQILRHLGLAARFVSGYLVQLTADVKSLDGPAGPEQDFTDLHAWCEVYVPGAGWIGLDPTSGLFAGEGHIPLACTPHFESAAAVTGLLDPCESTMEYTNSVTRIFEDPRVTKPYTPEQWAVMEALGYQIDHDLDKNDVRLTMGGEPTFVSIDDMESAEWNTTADGPLKRKLSHDLILKLKDKFGKGGLIHYGQGKWYPGEPLPRWQYTLYWRKDNVALYHKPQTMADININYGFGKNEALKFADTLAKYLNLSSHYVIPAYEDILYYFWNEGNVPNNLNPREKNIKDSLERQFMAELLEKGLGETAGYVIPIEWSHTLNKWLSSTWKFRKKNLFLIPGNSPIGLRIPLDSLEYLEPEAREKFYEYDPLDDLPPLDNYREKRNKTPFNIADEPLYIVRTALSVEPRDGKLFVFFPPLSKLELYLELLAIVEAVSEHLGFPIVIEGYEPPKDQRLEKLVISPDPGVVEVNIHPAKSWRELTSNYSTLFEEARLSRLGTEKFMVDGRHTGTGGGNHVTIGGVKSADSPLLRRPDLLRSLITYWQHHPGLSYMFAGAFIGPTSQAPRVDEGRDDRLYELEIAFSHIPTDGKGYIPFWLTDRLLRNLLVDITGNTHRSEFCIDKLYSPDSPSGRLGILEFRAFDMPPHYQMCMLQLLLIRGLVAKFWQKPYKGKLIRWGTELHDRFLLPHYCFEDIKEVCADLKEFGYEFDHRWFEPFFEFRFPRHGSVQVGSIHMEIRMAIEPWHVLGEEATSQGTARYVDSSLERVQIKVTGMTDKRHFLLCNGKRVPLRNTGVIGEYVAGIRYKAWNPPSSLHPVIEAQSPLVFDLMDSWTGRSVGGCQYHVSHPGGRSYDTFPVNNNEAESRRINRFWDIGYTPGARQLTPVLQPLIEFQPEGSKAILYKEPQEIIDDEFPYCLDLRK